MSRAARFDLADFEVRRVKVADPQPSIIWPVPVTAILRVGESVVAKRKGSGRAHKGLDIFVPPGTAVIAAEGGRVLRVFDARGNLNPDLRRAGLFVDVLSSIVPLDGLWIHRYLHLWKAAVRTGEQLETGAQIALTGTARATGIEHSGPHLHFEIRRAVQERDGSFRYGEPVDPLRLLPPITAIGDANV